MAVTRREYIFSAFLLGVLCVLLVVVAISSDSWVISSALTAGSIGDNVRYGLFRGELEINTFITPTSNVLYMTCVSSENACAVSCKTTPEARQSEVAALAQGWRPALGCNTDASHVPFPELDPPPVISMVFYVALLVLVFLQLLFAVLSAGLAINNATRNPTEPIFGLPGCLWSNVVTVVCGVTVLLMFGIYWAVSDLQKHLAFNDIAQGSYMFTFPKLGYSYWLLIAAVLCSLCNVGLLQLRQYLLERDPPPPTIKVENHSDGTIFLY